MEGLIFCQFERENKSEVLEENWNDPYDSIWLKLVTIFISGAEILASIIMVAFVIYETRVYGYYRTLINQLLSFLYSGVRHDYITHISSNNKSEKNILLYINYEVSARSYKYTGSCKTIQ